MNYLFKYFNKKNNAIILFLFVCFCLTNISYGSTYYMPDNFSNLNAAFSGMSGGDELIIRDGTYSGDSNTINYSNYPPLGSSGAYTVIRAENPGNVVIDGQGSRRPIHYEPGGSTDAYWEIRGIVFKNSSNQVVYIVRTSHVKFFECGFFEAGSTSDAFSTHTCSYILLEDCYSWGNARYHFHFYNTDHSIFRRCVARHDRGSWDYQNGFQLYASQYIGIQNCIVIDGDTGDYGSPSQLHAFKIPQVSSGNIYFTGCIALNNPDMTMSLVQAGDAEWNNSIGWGLNNGVTFRSSGSVTWNHMTLGNIGQYGANGDGTTKILTNSIVYDCITYGLFNWEGSFTSDYNSLYANGTDYYGVTDGGHDLCAANSNPVDIIDGSPGNGIISLKYLPRIEDGSDLDVAASDVGDIGATILKKIGTSGSLWGETGYNVMTDVDLWPWYHEDVIRENMRTYSHNSVSGIRGFCADGQTLTKYIWEYLGNPIPPEIYLPGTPANLRIE